MKGDIKNLNYIKLYSLFSVKELVINAMSTPDATGLGIGLR